MYYFSGNIQRAGIITISCSICVKNALSTCDCSGTQPCKHTHLDHIFRCERRVGLSEANVDRKDSAALRALEGVVAGLRVLGLAPP